MAIDLFRVSMSPLMEWNLCPNFQDCHQERYDSHSGVCRQLSDALLLKDSVKKKCFRYEYLESCLYGDNYSDS